MLVLPAMNIHRLLSTILSLVLLLSLNTAYSQEKVDAGPAPKPEEEAAAADLIKRGALVQPIAANLNWRYVSFRGLEKPDAAAFALIAKLPATIELDLAGMELGAADLAAVAGLKALVKLNLSSSKVDDAGLAHLKGLQKLESLNLFNTSVTDAGLAALHGLKSLKRIYLYNTKVTDAGADALAKALPALKIDRGWDKALPPAAPKPEEKKPEPPKPPAAAPKPEEKKPEPPKQ